MLIAYGKNEERMIYFNSVNVESKYRSKSVRQYAARWSKHAACNFAQAINDVRWFTEPTQDMMNKLWYPDFGPGSRRWYAYAMMSRVAKMAANLWWALMPPELHDNPEGVAMLDKHTLSWWFKHALHSVEEVH